MNSRNFFLKKRNFFIEVSFLFLSFSFVFSEINFSSQTSKIFLNNSSGLIVDNTISSWKGSLEKTSGSSIRGSAISFDKGIFIDEDGKTEITGIYDPDSTFKVLLLGNKTLKVDPGTFLNKINVHGFSNKLQGQPLFSNSDSICLENENSELSLAIQTDLKSNIEIKLKK